jgi:hypothetical protein
VGAVRSPPLVLGRVRLANERVGSTVGTEMGRLPLQLVPGVDQGWWSDSPLSSTGQTARSG